MTTMPDEPKFGSFNPEIEYRRRAGAYAVIFDECGRFAAVRGITKLFLPGGGIEPNESLEEALAREVREECAREAVIGHFLGSAIQYFSERDGSQHWEFHCSYFAAKFGAPLSNEPEHELLWLELDDADKLAFDVHRWGVSRQVQISGNGQD
ncbi:MAG: NUDIX domain-containing protein [Acidobacteria bacterium]|nr:NUDIX domain-containing protein [Acidobacteriota bacterium]